MGMCHTELLFKKLKLSQDVVDCCAKKLMNKKIFGLQTCFSTHILWVCNLYERTRQAKTLSDVYW